MNNNYPDKILLDNLNLDLPEFKTAKKLFNQKKYHQAAIEASEQLFCKPFSFHPFNENDIQPIVTFLKKNCISQINYLISYADNCLLPEVPVKPKGISDEVYAIRYLNAIATHRGRASGGYILMRLYHLTGNKKYFDGFIKIAEYAINKLAELQDGDHPPSFAWHPNPGETSGHDPGHVGEELLMALPLYRTLLSAEQKIYFAKMFLKIADFNYRAVSKDCQFNIPNHLMTTSHCISCVFPQFKKASIWKDWARNRIVNDFTSEYSATKDGYFREGIGYQNVVHNLLLKNIIFWKATGDKVPQKILKVSERSFEFATKILRLDGTFPLEADSGPYASHERHIVFHEMLHLAAVFFNRNDFLNMAGSPWKEEPKEILFWDLGWNGIQKWLRMKKQPRNARIQQPHDLRNSGFQILGTGKISDGHQGMLTYACNINHSHFDVGSIDIWGYGRPLITDPGFAGYNQISQAVDLSDRSHSLTMLSRVKPLGPRLEGNHFCPTNQVVHQKDIQYATFENRLYETHIVQRTVCLITPGNKTESNEPFWIVLDTIRRKIPWPGKDEPYELAETFFHFNAPDSDIGVDEKNQTVWSKHSGKNKKLKRYEGEDIFFKRDFKLINFHNYIEAIEGSDSNANIQVSAIPKKGDYDYVFGMRTGTSFTCQYGGRIKRPMVTYLFSGDLPYTCAYVLVPFKGVINKPYAKVNGHHDKKDIMATVETPKFITQIKITNAGSTTPKISYERKTKQPKNKGK